MLKSYKLGKDFRLRTSKDFQLVYQQARKFRHDCISVLVCNNKLTHSRIGTCITKKQIPRAVDRNRIKRIIKESFRMKKNELNVGLDMLFYVYSASLKLSNLEIQTCLEVLWGKLTKFYRKV